MRQLTSLHLFRGYVNEFNAKQLMQHDELPSRHLDITVEQLEWLYKKAFGFDLPDTLTTDDAIIAILMERGFAWAEKTLADRVTKSVGTTNQNEGDPQ